MLEKRQKNIVLTADDYGIRETARPILDLARAGKLQRVSVLVHHISRAEVDNLLKTGVKIDVHLELMEFLKSGHTMKANAWLRGLNFGWRFSLGKIRVCHVEAQWREQIERFRELFGQLPDGFNSHEHIHYFPTFFRVFLRLAREYKIPFVRFGRRGISSVPQSNIVSKVLAILRKHDQADFLETHLETTDFMMSLDWIPDAKAFLEKMPSGTVEVIVHPEREEELAVINQFF